MPVSFPGLYEFQGFHEIYFADIILIPVFSFPWLFSSVCMSLGTILRQLCDTLSCTIHFLPCVFGTSHSTENEFRKDQRWKLKAQCTVIL